LGAGFGGLTTANLLQKNLSLSSVEHQISIVDSKNYFLMGLVNLWILSGIRTLEDSKVALSRLENKGISYLNGEVTAIDPVSRTVTIKGSSTLRLEYDYLVIALGTEFANTSIKKRGE
jgi:sulfide:quinone oxidoreductase